MWFVQFVYFLYFRTRYYFISFAQATSHFFLLSKTLKKGKLGNLQRMLKISLFLNNINHIVGTYIRINYFIIKITLPCCVFKIRTLHSL